MTLTVKKAKFAKTKKFLGTVRQFGVETIDSAAMGGVAGLAVGAVGGLGYVAVKLYSNK